MGNWTPGPWHFDGPPDNHIIWSSPDDRVCFMAHSNGVDPERDTANAALVAAAPDLLEALQSINRMGSPRADRTLGECADELQLIVDIARAAIAKATGEQP